MVGGQEGKINFEQFMLLFGEDSGGEMKPVASSSQARGARKLNRAHLQMRARLNRKRRIY